MIQRAIAQFTWDFYIGNDPLGEPKDAVFWTKHLLHRWGCRVDLHWMVRADRRNCFHTHPAWAIRHVVSGGYVEEVYDPKRDRTYFKRWAPGSWGLVGPRMTHRIHRLLHPEEGSVSLWFRGPVVAQIMLAYFDKSGKFVYDEPLAKQEN